MKSNDKLGIISFFYGIIGCVVTYSLQASHDQPIEQSIPWELTEDDQHHQLQIWRRDHSFGVPEYKAEIVVTAPPHSFIALLLDTDNYSNWADRGLFAKIVKQNDELLIHTGIDLPWPLRNRDLVALTKLDVDSETCTIHLNSHSRPAALPIPPKFVRIKQFEAHWKIEPIGNGFRYSRIQYHGAVHLGGKLIKPLFSRLGEQSLQKTMLNIQHQLLTSNYHNPLGNGPCLLPVPSSFNTTRFDAPHE